MLDMAMDSDSGRPPAVPPGGFYDLWAEKFCTRDRMNTLSHFWSLALIDGVSAVRSDGLMHSGIGVDSEANAAAH